MSIKAEIAVELYEAARQLGAKSDLLGIIGSYGDTLSDEEVLDALRNWNGHISGGRRGQHEERSRDDAGASAN